MRTRIANLLTSMIGVGLMLFTGYCRLPLDPVNRAIEEIPIGTPRLEALELLRDLVDFECHIECWRPNGEVEDLFFYGECNPDSGTVIIVGSELVSDTLHVYQVGTFEDYALHAAYDWCLEVQLPTGD